MRTSRLAGALLATAVLATPAVAAGAADATVRHGGPPGAGPGHDGPRHGDGGPRHGGHPGHGGRPGHGPRHRPRFVARVRPLSPPMRRWMTGRSYKPGCPVGLDALRSVDMTFWGFDGRVHIGRLVVNADVADKTVRAFRALYDARFPIRRMIPVDAFDADDDRSMAADNTSAFNCRPITGTTDRWSNHSYGRAIDINTIENPYVKGDTVLPDAGAAFLDRTDVRPGMIVAGDAVTRAFAAEGFGWGGDYTSLKDYQHFEIPADG